MWGSAPRQMRRKPRSFPAPGASGRRRRFRGAEMPGEHGGAAPRGKHRHRPRRRLGRRRFSPSARRASPGARAAAGAAQVEPRAAPSRRAPSRDPRCSRGEPGSPCKLRPIPAGSAALRGAPTAARRTLGSGSAGLAALPAGLPHPATGQRAAPAGGSPGTVGAANPSRGLTTTRSRRGASGRAGGGRGAGKAAGPHPPSEGRLRTPHARGPRQSQETLPGGLG